MADLQSAPRLLQFPSSEGTSDTDPPPLTGHLQAPPDDLARIIEMWLDLPLPIRVSILALVDAADQQQQRRAA